MNIAIGIAAAIGITAALLAITATCAAPLARKFDNALYHF